MASGGRLDEAAVIDRFRQRLRDASVLCGIGDDAAVLRYAGPLAATCDVLVEGTHFKPGTNPYYLGRKALAVNLSDLAAMGAAPKHALVALTLPRADAAWLARFAKGLLAVAAEHGVSVVGGDVTGGRTLSISITALGAAPKRPLYHSGAKPGDDLWVSGEIGKAAWEWESKAKPGPRSALHNPRPQVELGQFLAGVAAAAVDLSDGLAKGIAVLAKASGCGFAVDAAAVPFHPKMAGDAVSRRRALTFGEDYQLLFAARPKQRAAIAAYGRRTGLALSRIGSAEGKASFVLDEGKKISIQRLTKETYDHFKKSRSEITIGSDMHGG
ncbi:MAG: thiamine-phosphate kinase, partial [Betaproteobacteria bacterium AqS2]|nr:thiamine-phosphate kinase [Betaproteobacteria bacterium AqS2]